ncbi:16S rRNA processing protein RimM [hydrothermal vent metagenome]|uniref:16S rRNA processing protein RimM n=1 Tax=hydrothermal vent metagenome TaxID=652676 RepID=A0A1W1CHQ5_9ZZZZ
MSNDASLIAQIGRTIGLWGDLKFHIHTDFPEQFQVGKTYQSNRANLTISDINHKRGTIRFVGYESIDAAKKLTNVKIFADEAQTRQNCDLEEGEYFWFDIIGCLVKEDDEIVGKVTEIQRMADTDYLVIKTDEALVKKDFSKSFLLPYIERYILKSHVEEKIIYTKDAKDILEAS